MDLSQGFGVYFAYYTRNVPAVYNESAIISVVSFNVAFTSVVVLPLTLFVGAEIIWSGVVILLLGLNNLKDTCFP